MFMVNFRNGRKNLFQEEVEKKVGFSSMELPLR